MTINTLVIVQDSREQTPWSFPGIPVRVAALPAGDYSVAGLESVFSIERKELNDLVACITFERERFERELARGACLRSLYLLVESDLSTIEAGRYRSKVSPNAVIGSLVAWLARFPNLKTLFAGSRAGGQRLAGRILSREWIEAQK